MEQSINSQLTEIRTCFAIRESEKDKKIEDMGKAISQINCSVARIEFMVIPTVN
jgi:hypothetical protein